MFNLLTREEVSLFWSCEHWRFTKRFKTYGQTNRSHKLQYVIPVRDGFTASTYFQFHHQFALGQIQTERSVDPFGFTPIQTEKEDGDFQNLLIWWFPPQTTKQHSPCPPDQIPSVSSSNGRPTCSQNSRACFGSGRMFTKRDRQSHGGTKPRNTKLHQFC